MSTAKATSARVLVVVPAYNEADAIARVVRDIHATAPGADVLVVDDGSQDITAEVARAAGALVARLPFNLGVGGAMRTGFRYALRRGYTALVQVDGDGQHDPAFIPDLLTELSRADIAVGSRFAGSDHYTVSGPRRWAMRGLATGMSRLMRTPLDDATSGFRAYGPRAIRVFAEHYPAEYLGDTLETLVIARKCNLTVTQLPVTMRLRMTGQPSHGPLRSCVDLVRAGAVVMLGLVRDWSLTAEAAP